MILLMPDYKKTLTPPDGQAFLETPDGLKYWLVRHGPSPGLQQSVLTEDESIALHVYGGSRERGATYLMCYKGFQIGFFCHDESQGYFPWRDKEPELDQANNIVTVVVTGIGTPVWDEASTLVPDGKGGQKVDLRARRRGEGYVTDISFDDYNDGKRTQFESSEQQGEILALLPHLLSGQVINLARLRPGWENKPRAVVIFSDALKAEYEIAS